MRKFSSRPIQNEVLTINFEHPFSKYHYARKFQDNIYPYNQIFEQPEEELTSLTKHDREKLHSNFDKHLSEMKAMNEHIAATLAKIHDKSDKKIEKTATEYISPNHRAFIQTN